MLGASSSAFRRSFSRALETGQCARDRNDVSRETIPRNPLPFFTRAGSEFQIRTPERASCAQCAPESPAEPAGLVLRMFRLHDRRSSAVGSMFRLVRPESDPSRGDRSISRLQDRASHESQRSAPTPKNSHPAPQELPIRSPANHSAFLILNSEFPHPPQQFPRKEVPPCPP